MSDRGNDFWDEADEYWTYNRIQKDIEEESIRFSRERIEASNKKRAEEEAELDPEPQEAPVEDGPEVTEFLDSMNTERRRRSRKN